MEGVHARAHRLHNESMSSLLVSGNCPLFSIPLQDGRHSAEGITERLCTAAEGDGGVSAEAVGEQRGRERAAQGADHRWPGAARQRPC